PREPRRLPAGLARARGRPVSARGAAGLDHHLVSLPGEPEGLLRRVLPEPRGARLRHLSRQGLVGGLLPHPSHPAARARAHRGAGRGDRRAPPRCGGAIVIRAVIVDWAGTIVDFGSIAPVDTFIRVFARHGVEISTAEARAPMGQGKRDHIQSIASAVEERWADAHGGRAPTTAGIDTKYAEIIPLQIHTLGAHA